VCHRQVEERVGRVLDGVHNDGEEKYRSEQREGRQRTNRFPAPPTIVSVPSSSV
jgi:hypothetical protein